MVASDDTKALLEDLRAVPPFTGDPLTDDGTVTTVPDGTIPFLNNVSYGAKAGQGVVFAVGGGSKERVGELLGARAESDPSLIPVVHDMGRMGELMGQPRARRGPHRWRGRPARLLQAVPRGDLRRSGSRARARSLAVGVPTTVALADGKCPSTSPPCLAKEKDAVGACAQ